MSLVKRPFIWILISFTIGIVCNKYICSILKFIPILLVTYLLCFLFFHFLKQKYPKNPDYFFFILPLFVCAGFVLPLYLNGISQLADEFLEESVTVQGKIINIVEKSSFQELYLSDVQIQNKKMKGHVSQILIQDTDFLDISLGDELVYHGELQEFESASNPGQYDGKAYYEAKGVRYKIWDGECLKHKKARLPVSRWVRRMKRSMSNTYHQVLEQEDSEILHAMILGDKSELSLELKKLYQKAGISHILAISGLHISMIGLLFFRLLKKAGLHHNLASFLCILLIYIYGIMTGFSISTNRAVIMMILSLSACFFCRSYDSQSALALSALIVLIQQPYQLFQCGFQLSFLAVAGTVCFLPVCRAYIGWCFTDFEQHMQRKEQSEYYSLGVLGNRITKIFRSSLLTSAAIQFVTLPVILWFYYEFASLAPIINLFILPLASALILLAFTIAIIGVVCLPLARFLSGSIHAILLFYQYVCKVFQKIPFNRILIGRPEEWQILCFFLCTVLFIICVHQKIHKSSGMLLFLGLLILMWKTPVHGLNITMLDVGQGESIFGETEEGVTFLVDGGSTDTSAVGTYRILPFLKYSGIGSLDYCFVTHVDEDHISGIKELIASSKEEVGMKHLVMGAVKGISEEEAFLELVKAAEQAGIQVLYMERGDTLSAGKLLLTCLHPYNTYLAADRNSASLVLELTYDAFAMLLTGDVDEAGEREILKDGKIGQSYDVLKVAHHGSKYSTCEAWLSCVNPQLALISCGKDNRYGHPHKELTERLEGQNATVKVTRECGAVQVCATGKKMKVREYSLHKVLKFTARKKKSTRK